MGNIQACQSSTYDFLKQFYRQLFGDGWLWLDQASVIVKIRRRRKKIENQLYALAFPGHHRRRVKALEISDFSRTLSQSNGGYQVPKKPRTRAIEGGVKQVSVKMFVADCKAVQDVANDVGIPASNILRSLIHKAIAKGALKDWAQVGAG